MLNHLCKRVWSRGMRYLALTPWLCVALSEQISDDVYEAWIYGLDQQDAHVREIEAGSRIEAV